MELWFESWLHLVGEATIMVVVFWRMALHSPLKALNCVDDEANFHDNVMPSPEGHLADTQGQIVSGRYYLVYMELGILNIPFTSGTEHHA